MVKISSKELYDFYLPIPNITIQNKIAEEIKQQLDEQEKIKEQIKNERKKIDALIESAINEA